MFRFIPLYLNASPDDDGDAPQTAAGGARVEGHEATEQRILERIAAVCTPHRKPAPQHRLGAMEGSSGATPVPSKFSLTTPQTINLRTAR